MVWLDGTEWHELDELKEALKKKAAKDTALPVIGKKSEAPGCRVPELGDGFLCSRQEQQELKRPDSARIRRPLEGGIVPSPPHTARPTTSLLAYRNSPSWLSASAPGASSSHEPALASTKLLPLRLSSTARSSFTGRPMTSAESSRSSLSLADALAASRRPPVQPVPHLRDEVPAWWTPREADSKAIDAFDVRHRQNLQRANRMQDELRADVTSLRKTRATDTAIWELGHNRYFLEETLKATRVYEKRLKPRKAKKWKLVGSIWWPRRKSCDAKDFYDTPAVKRRAFEADWERAVARTKLDKKVERAVKGLDPATAEEDGNAAPIDALREAMFDHFDLTYQTFDFYGQLGSGSDIFAITSGSFDKFIRDCDLVNNELEGQRDQDLRLLFETVNASAGKSADAQFDSKRSLSRCEWLAVLAQLALERYVAAPRGETADDGKGRLSVTHGVRRLFHTDMRPNIDVKCLQDSNSFRADYCYLEDVDLVLKSYEHSLRHLFEAFAYGTGAIGDAVLSTKLMDVTEFNEFVYRLDLIDEFITQREVRLAFLWSRMLVVDETTIKGRSSVLQLKFEDFLEMLVRLAYMMALPEEQDLDEAGVSHAGEFLVWLSGYPDEEDRFKQAHTRYLGSKKPLEQPIATKVRQLIEWILYAVRGGTGGACEPISRKEADKFKKGLVARIRREEAGSGGGGAPNLFGEDDDVEIRRDEATAPELLHEESELRSKARVGVDYA